MSKNVKEQRAKVFGTSASSSGKMRDKHIAALIDFAKRRYGISVLPSRGKFDEEAGRLKNPDAEIGVDKPDWRDLDESGKPVIRSQMSGPAISHELSHLELMPEGVGAPEGQKMMDDQYKEILRNHGWARQKNSQYEIQPQAAENPLRRRAGLPVIHRDIPVKPDTPERRTVDTDEPSAIRLQVGDKFVDQAASSRLLRPEYREQIDQIDRGELRYHPETGWGLGEDINSKINQRARFASFDESRKDAKTLMRNDEDEEKKMKIPRDVYERGVHKDLQGEGGKSWTGHIVRQKKAPEFRNIYAKEQHQRVLGDLKNMPKPNLPKSEEGGVKPAIGKHIIFSMDNPAHGKHDENAHSAMVQTLKNNGADFEEIQGQYGKKPERSIKVNNPDEGLHQAITSVLKQQGQESYIVSNGEHHKMKFLNGELAGKHVRGSGTVFHDTEPEDNYSKDSSGKIYTHNFDFTKIHD